MKRAVHNLSHEKLATFNMGELVPLTVYEGLPNDTIRGSTSLLLRTQPLFAPIMHKCRVSIYNVAVPLRLIWANWEAFRTGGADGNDETTHPYIVTPASTGFAVGSLADYLGLPTGIPDVSFSALPFRAYQLIWNEYFRDKDLQTEAVVSTGSGLDTTTDLNLKFGCWEKDYFTSARPYPQLGDAVTIPLSGNAPLSPTTAPVDGTGDSPTLTVSGTTRTLRMVSGNNAWNANGGAGTPGVTGDGVWTTTALETDLDGVEADLSDVAAVNIEDLRLASAIQRFKERMSRFGHTLPEFYRSFGVSPQDSRMQWPELIGSGSSVIQFSEVLQTAEGTNPVGELAGHGISAARSNRFKYHVQEDCLILTLCIVRPQTVYMQATQKMWHRSSRYDYFLPDLQNLGQQPILNKEINAGHASPSGVFGYQDQYDDYRRIENSVSGEFRDTLDFWHMARDIPNDVALNSTFVQANPTDRIYATSADQLQVRAMHKIQAKRLVARKSKPRLM